MKKVLGLLAVVFALSFPLTVNASAVPAQPEGQLVLESPVTAVAPAQPATVQPANENAAPVVVAPPAAAPSGVVAVEPGSTVIVSAPATAAPVQDSTVVDFGGLVSALAIAAWGLLAFLAVGLWKLLSKIPFVSQFMTQDQYNKLVDPLLNEAIAFGVGKLENADWLKVDTKNEAVATAVNYVIDHGGELLAKFGISRDMLKEKLEAKLVQNGWDKKPGEWDKVTGDPETKVG